MSIQLDFSRCPRCGAQLQQSTSWIGSPSEFWLECPHCNTYVNTYIPMEHQLAVHLDNHRFIGNFGGYGTGKTTTTREEVIKHLLITPRANALIGANVSAQYAQTIKRELEADIPAAFIQSYSTKDQYMDLKNGARLMWRSFDDPDKLRSLNLSFFAIIEGSETSAEVFSQLKTRLRSTAAMKQCVDDQGHPVFEEKRNGKRVPKYEKDWRRGIVESNPDSGYIRTDVLLVSDKINQYGDTVETYALDRKRIDPLVSSHVASTSVNTYLPNDFISGLMKNKPDWWVRRYLFGSFQFAEGLVYPTAATHIVSAFDIPRHWKRLVAFDYGLSDNAAYVLAAIDPKDGICYIYKEDVTKNRNIKDLASIYYRCTRDIPEGGLYTPPIIDPKSGVKRDYNKKTLIDLFLDEGISFKPGHINVDARVFRTNTYFETGKLKIFDTCDYLINELKNYKFPDKSLDSGRTKNLNKPVDKDNHAINPLEWICMELPANPDNLILTVYNSRGASLEDMEEAYQLPLMPWQLEDKNDDYECETFDNDRFDMRRIW